MSYNVTAKTSRLRIHFRMRQQPCSSLQFPRFRSQAPSLISPKTNKRLLAPPPPALHRITPSPRPPDCITYTEKGPPDSGQAPGVSFARRFTQAE